MNSEISEGEEYGMKKDRILAFVLAAAMSASLLAGCSSNGKPGTAKCFGAAGGGTIGSCGR